jgi:hypothetical protein
MPVVLVLLVLGNYALKNGDTSRNTMLIITLMKIHQLGQTLLNTDTQTYFLHKKESTLKYT